MAANNIILKRVNIAQANGWVPLSATPLVADVTLHPLSSTISMRILGGTAVQMHTATYRLEGIDLSHLEISTTSSLEVGFIVIGNTRGPRS